MNRIDYLKKMVLSVSGWRAVFGTTDQSTSASLRPEQRDLVAVAAAVYADAVISRRADASPTVVLGTDSRPTGPAIADTALRVLITKGVAVRYLGIVAAPEIMSYTKRSDAADGFFYISASHNPPGHNGLKMGFEDGAVMPRSEATPLIAEFTRRAEDDAFVDALVRDIQRIAPDEIGAVVSQRSRWKNESYTVYRDFAVEVASAMDHIKTHQLTASEVPFVERLRRRLESAPLGVVAELNGSARSVSIDRALLTEVGVRLAVYNDEPGTFSHQILPEGAGLDDAAELLKRHHRIDPAFQVAYVPDNDGDRGNLVFFDEEAGAVPLDPQSVFAFVVTIELAWLRHLGIPREKVAVVANGPTSIRIDRICDAFGATLFRAEVGEANVVAKSRELRATGWVVAILGEGSNGGNITPPSTVRDPLSTLFGLIKFHAFDLGRYWNDNGGEPQEPRGNASASDDTLPPPFLEFVRRLPRFLTIGTDDPRAKMHVGEIFHGDLKARYEERLPTAVAPILEELSRRYGNGITYRVVNFEGTDRRDGIGNRSGDERGGLRVVFSTPDRLDRAAVWMRGSGTEPVFRVLADCEGEDVALLDALIAWQRDLVAAAVGGDNSD